MAEQRYLVDWDGILTDAADHALAAAGVMHLTSSGGALGGPHGEIPPPDHHNAFVDATSEGDAIDRVRNALADHGVYTGFTARPAP
jgi:hypothetical protein